MKLGEVKLDILSTDTLLSKIDKAAKVLATDEYNNYRDGAHATFFNVTYLPHINFSVRNFICNKRNHVIYAFYLTKNDGFIYYIDLNARIDDNVKYILDTKVKLYKEYNHESKRFTKSVIRIYEVFP